MDLFIFEEYGAFEYCWLSVNSLMAVNSAVAVAVLAIDFGKYLILKSANWGLKRQPSDSVKTAD